MVKHRIFIEFRNADMTKEVFRSPVFEAPSDLMDDSTFLGQKFDDLIVDGDDETDFCIPCDMQGSGINIVWNMFEPFDKEWCKNLRRVWNRHLGFALPSWSEWESIADTSEAFVR